MGIVGLLSVVFWCGSIVGFFIMPDYTAKEIDYFTTGGNIILIES